ncbi:MAG TPA: hypothetical protein VG709_00285, partial [Actinomycetota bacterium]|nr:hypothetical protein [Actinomycetota bacterium]
FTVSATNSQIQTTVAERIRARVVGLFLLAFGGLFPLASLIAGTIADAIGAPLTTAGGAVICLGWGLSLLWTWRERSPAVERSA